MNTETRQRLMAGEKFHCECCGQYCQVYRRGIHAQMVRNLYAIYAAGGPIRSRDFLRENGGDHAKLRWWGLVTALYTDDGVFWTITQKGTDFIRGTIGVPRRVLVYDNTVLGYEDETDIVYVWQVKRLPFDLFEVMGWPGI